MGTYWVISIKILKTTCHHLLKISWLWCSELVSELSVKYTEFCPNGKVGLYSYKLDLFFFVLWHNMVPSFSNVEYDTWKSQEIYQLIQQMRSPRLPTLLYLKLGLDLTFIVNVCLCVYILRQALLCSLGWPETYILYMLVKCWDYRSASS